MTSQIEIQETTDRRHPFALTEAEIEKNAAQSERENLAEAEAAREENEAPGGIYAGSTVEIQETTGSAVVLLLERVHERIRQNHPELPEVVIVTGAGLSGRGGKWGHFRAQGWATREHESPDRNFHEMFMAGETLAKGAEQVLQTMLHESAHLLAHVRKIQDTSRQGRWHNKRFLKVAQEVGLEYKHDEANSAIGYSQVTLTQDTREEYADLLAELDRQISIIVLLPTHLGDPASGGGADGGGEHISRGTSSPGSDNGRLICECPEPNIIRASKKVAERMVVRCDDCEQLFRAQ